MVAVRVLAVTAVAVLAAGCADGNGPGVSAGTAGDRHFTPLSLTSRAAPQARQSAPMAYYPPGREIVLFGGATPYRHGSEHGLGDTWVFNQHGWRRLHPRHSPPARQWAAMAYDPRTRLLMLFGGYSARFKPTSVLSDTWAWNGTDWSQLRAVRLPTWMPGAPIAWDPAAHRIIELAPRPGYPGSFAPVATFNGNGGPLGRWLWTGRSWTYRAENPAPPMDGGALAPDPLSGGMLYFSYTPDAVDDSPPPDPTGTVYSQTWLWHDGHFTRQSPSRAPGGPVLMASDPRIGRLVAVDTAGRLWAWAGTTWRPLTSGRGPREGAAAVYDPALGDLVVFGTVTRTGTTSRQTWLWNGTRWIIGP